MLNLARLPKRVRIFEVGPRDGLQHENPVSTDVKVKLVDHLSVTGLANIETTCFVAKTKVPRMMDHADVCARIKRQPDVTYHVVTPIIQGYRNAITAGMREVAVFGSASESFCQKNIMINCTMAESLERMKSIINQSKNDGAKIRGHVNCVFADPDKNVTPPSEVARIAKILYDLGCYEISLVDTTGVGTPGTTSEMLEAVLQVIPAEHLAVHFHNTFGQALANIEIALSAGISTIESSVAGLGSCPYTPGSPGNVATEDVVYMLNGLGIEHGVDLNKLLEAGRFISKQLKKQPTSSVHLAMSPKNFWLE